MLDKKIIISTTRKSNFCSLKYSEILAEYYNANDVSSYIKCIKKLLQNNDFEEAIYIASPSLYHSMKRINHLTDRKIEQTFLASYEYLKRSVNRATPFGIFASVSFGATESNKSGFSRCVRVSPEYMLCIYQDIINNINYFPEQRLSLSPTVIKQGNYLVNYVQGENPCFDENECIRYKMNNVVHRIYITLKNEPKTVLFLLKKLIEMDSSIDIKDFVKILQQLLEERLIIGELYPKTGYSLIEFKSYLKKVRLLSNKIDLTTKFSLLTKYISDYEAYGSISKIRRVNKEAKQIYSVKVPVIVDAQFDGIDWQTPSNLKNDICQFADFVTKASKIYEGTNKRVLNIFKNKFIEKYGYDCPIRILDVFDEIEGLGSPFYRPLFSNKFQDETNLKFKNSVLLWKENEFDKEELNLSNLKIENFDKLKDVKSDLDINFEIYKSEKKTMVVLGKTSTSLHSSNYNGRFSYFDKNNHYFSNQNVRYLSYVPQSKKIQNVYYNVNLDKNNIVNVNGFCNSDGMNINSLFLLVTNNNELKIIDNQRKEVRLQQGCMANPSFESDIIKTLVWLTSNYSDTSELLNELLMLNTNTGKRIVFNDLILSPVNWSISTKNILKYVRDFEGLRQFLKKKFVPKCVNVVKFDQILSLDLSSDNDIKLLIRIAKRSHSDNLIFQEKIRISDQNKFEATFSINEYKKESKKVDILSKQKIDVFRREERYPLDWFYVKLYLPRGEENDFILHHLCEYIDSDARLEKWFFIRYADPRPHIRFRYLSMDLDLNINTLAWVQHLKNDGVILDYAVVPYYRELERYGGIENLDKVEELFHYDSILISKILKICFKNRLSEDEKDALILLDLKNILKNINISDKVILSTLETDQLKNKELKRKIPVYKKIFPNFDKVEHNLFNFENKVSETINEIINNKQYIETTNDYNLLSSLIHMHFNRLDGNLSYENILRAQSYRILREFYWRRRK